MSVSQWLLDGALRAAQLLPLLFVLHGTPVQAQTSRVQDGGVAALDADIRSQAFGELPLTLLAQHHDVRVTVSGAEVRSRLTLRNDGASTVFAHYQLTQPAQILRDERSTGLVDLAQDLSRQSAEMLEAREPPGADHLLSAGDVLQVSAGETIALVLDRRLDVSRRGHGYQIELPLASDRDAPLVPRLSADVLVEAATPVLQLRSPTHEALVDGVGEPLALLSVVDGMVHRATTLAVQFELSPSVPAAVQQASSSHR